MKFTYVGHLPKGPARVTLTSDVHEGWHQSWSLQPPVLVPVEGPAVSAYANNGGTGRGDNEFYVSADANFIAANLASGLPISIPGFRNHLGLDPWSFHLLAFSARGSIRLDYSRVFQAMRNGRYWPTLQVQAATFNSFGRL